MFTIEQKKEIKEIIDELMDYSTIGNPIQLNKLIDLILLKM
jgi:hypothetical protein